MTDSRTTAKQAATGNVKQFLPEPLTRIVLGYLSNNKEDKEDRVIKVAPQREHLSFFGHEELLMAQMAAHYALFANPAKFKVLVSAYPILFLAGLLRRVICSLGLIPT